MSEKVCKACNRMTCFFIECGIEEKCPCIQCLVKVMCRSSCDEREQAKSTNTYLDFTRGLLYG